MFGDLKNQVDYGEAIQYPPGVTTPPPAGRRAGTDPWEFLEGNQSLDTCCWLSIGRTLYATTRGNWAMILGVYASTTVRCSWTDGILVWTFPPLASRRNGYSLTL